MIHNGVKCSRMSTDLHHCLISRNKRFSKWLDNQVWNYQPTCAICNRNTRDADRHDNRMAWLTNQIEYYGVSYMLDKLEDAPDKLKLFNQDYKEVYKEVSMRYAARADANQADIVQALRDVGASVWVTHRVGHGFPDICVGYKGVTYLMEIKDGMKPDSQIRLTPDEEEFFDMWGGHACIVYSIEDALVEIGISI